MFRFERDSDSRSPLRIKSLAQLTSYPASEIPHICGDKSYGRAFGDDLGGLTPELSRPARGETGGAEAAKRARLERIVRLYSPPRASSRHCCSASL